MPGIQLTGKAPTNATGGRSFAADLIRNNGGTGGTTPPSGTGPAGRGGSSSPEALIAAVSFATTGIRGMGAAANMATAALTAFERRLRSVKISGGGGGGGGGSIGGGGGRAGGIGGGGAGRRTPEERNDNFQYGQMRQQADWRNRQTELYSRLFEQSDRKERQSAEAAARNGAAMYGPTSRKAAMANWSPPYSAADWSNAHADNKSRPVYGPTSRKEAMANWKSPFSAEDWADAHKERSRRTNREAMFDDLERQTNNAKVINRFNQMTGQGQSGGGGGGGGAMNGAGHLLERVGRYGGVGELTNILGYAMTNPEILPAVALGAAAFAPQIGAAAYGGFMSATSPYRTFAMNSYGLARAGGFDGDSFISNLSDNGTPQSAAIRARLAKVGLGSSDAVSIMQQYGLGATSQGNFVDSATSLGAMAINPTLGNMDQGQLIAAQRTLGGMGFGGITQNTAAMADMLANANAKGYDKSVMVNSMVSSLTSLAGAGGLGGSTSAAGSFIASYAATGTAGGRNGMTAASVQSGLQGFANSSVSTPFGAAVSSRLASQFQTMADFQRKAPTVYAMAQNSPMLMKQIQDYLKAPLPFQANGIGSILQNDPNTYYSATNGVVTGIAGGGLAGVQATASLLGVSQGAVYTATDAASRGGEGGGANNNPLNLKYAGQRGAIGQDSRGFAIFPTVQAGLAAAQNQIKIDAGRGDTTLSKLINSWAPAGDNNDTNGYIKAVSSRTGYGANQTLNFNDPKVMGSVISAMRIQEGNSGGAANTPVSPGLQTQLNDNATNANMDLQGAKATFMELNGSVNLLAKAVAALQGAVTQIINSPTAPGTVYRNHPNKTPFTGHN